MKLIRNNKSNYLTMNDSNKSKHLPANFIIN